MPPNAKQGGQIFEVDFALKKQVHEYYAWTLVNNFATNEKEILANLSPSQGASDLDAAKATHKARTYAKAFD